MFMKKFFERVREIWWKWDRFWYKQSKQLYNRNNYEYEDKRRLENPIYLDRFGYKVYSQNDEDGMIAEIFNRIGTTNKQFVEFGVQDGLESNTHFLLHKGWHGIWIDGGRKTFKSLLSSFREVISSKQLLAINAFITSDNINHLIGTNGNLNGEIDLLSIDIDGNDYWIWEAITCIVPRVVIIEYNSKFPPDYEWVMKYNANHIWDGSDKFGASLKSFELLGGKLGYQLVGTNMNGVNAFFVKKEIASGLFPEPATAENLYHCWGNRRYVSSGFQSKKYIGNQ
jgi:hypothetical protein